MLNSNNSCSSPLETHKHRTAEEANFLFSPLKCIRATGWKGPLELGASRTIPLAVLVHANISELRQKTGEKRVAQAKARSQPPF